MRRVLIASVSLALAFSAIALAPAANLSSAAAAGCVRFVDSQFNPPGIDDQNLVEEWVRIKNVCNTGKSIAGWRIHDYNRIHTYTFPDGARIGAGMSVRLITGHGTNSNTRFFWNRDSSVWNNVPPEFAYLKKPDGTLQSKWTEY